MKGKILVSAIIFGIVSYEAFSQDEREGPTEGYIEYAVPPFDNRTRQLDFSKLERPSLKLYKPSPENLLQRNDHNAISSVTDNTDVQAFPSVDAQSEQHMTVSKIHPDNIILSSNTPYYQGYYVSQNGGTTWFGSDHMPDMVQSYGDPATAVDAEGELYLQTMTWNGVGSTVYSSSNQGTAWGPSVSYSYSPISFDKEMMAVDNLPGSPYQGNVYNAWTDFSGTYTVRFNRSTNGGASYLPNITLHNSWGQGTNVQTGTLGEVYVCWANYGTGSAPADGIGFTRSLNGGSSFTNLTPAFAYAGIRILGTDPLFNNTRVADFPSMAVDKSCSFTRGRIYIAYPAKQNGNGKAVILVRYSINQGTSWSAPIEVSIAAGRQNWFPWVTTDDVTGTVSVAYLSLDQATGFITNTYLAYSFDGGFSWSNIKVSDVGHTVAAIPGFATGYCGDYIANSAWANKNYVCWNDNRTGQWNNYVSRVDFSQYELFSSNVNINMNGPLSLALPQATDVHYQAVGDIISPTGSTLSIESGANVTMIAHGHIIFQPGFIAKAGSHLVAKIANVSPCVNTVTMDAVTEDIGEKFPDLKPAYNGDPTVQFAMYPNPAKNEITFEYLLPDAAEVTLTLMDLHGKEIKVLLNHAAHEPGLNRFTADISSLKNGIYAYRLITSDYVKAGKFVKAE